MTDHLAVYLNDHLAGSATAIELLTTLEALPGFEAWARTLRADIFEDRQELERVMTAIGVAPSAVRQAGGWLVEKLAEAKTRFHDRKGGDLYVLELVEALALGIDGKRALWTALQAASMYVPDLQRFDYPKLIGRAIEQRASVESRRQRLAEQAFASSPIVKKGTGVFSGPANSRARGNPARTTMMTAGGLMLGALLISKGLRQQRAIDFAGKSALVTGGSRGLGLLIARELGRAGASVAISARDEAELERARIDLHADGVSVTTFVADVGAGSDAERLVDEVIEAHGRLDVLINNAGVIQVGPIEHMTLADFDHAMAVHFWGPLHTMTAAIPHMRELGGGRIVNIGSIGGKIGVPHLIPYCASKFALTGLSTALRGELLKDGIRVTTVSPGLMRTGSPFNAEFKGQHRAEFAWFAIADSLPLVTIDGRRAAAKIVDAARHGDAELVITWPAQLAVLANAIAPRAVAAGLSLANRLLPGVAPMEGDEPRSGWQSTSRWAPSMLTRLTERSAAENNELPPTGLDESQKDI